VEIASKKLLRLFRSMRPTVHITRSMLSVALLASLGGCLLPHTSDAKMEERFRTHKVEFETLRKFMSEDVEMQAVFRGYTVPAFEKVSHGRFSEARLATYRQLLDAIGLRGVLRAGTDVVFEESVLGVGLQGDYKGYLYTESKSYKRETSLDDVRGGNCDYITKPLQGSWYLYLRDCTSRDAEVKHGPP
jgi:hypothetical protein